jgi:hypothetical protein
MGKAGGWARRNAREELLEGHYHGVEGRRSGMRRSLVNLEKYHPMQFPSLLQ